METLYNNQWSSKKNYQAAGESSWQGKDTGINPDNLSYASNQFPTEPTTVIVDSGISDKTKWIIGGSIAGVLLITTAVVLYKRLKK